eukprot:459874-Amphidinium_carterae.1
MLGAYGGPWSVVELKVYASMLVVLCVCVCVCAFRNAHMVGHLWHVVACLGWSAVQAYGHAVELIGLN